MSSTVWHGATYNVSPYRVVQLEYSLKKCEHSPLGQGYVELLEILDGEKDEPFIVHIFLYNEGSSYFVYDELKYATVGFEHCLGNKFVRSRDLWLPGCKSWNHIGYNLPWFYSEAEAEVAEVSQQE